MIGDVRMVLERGLAVLVVPRGGAELLHPVVSEKDAAFPQVENLEIKDPRSAIGGQTHELSGVVHPAEDVVADRLVDAADRMLRRRGMHRVLPAQETQRREVLIEGTDV